MTEHELKPSFEEEFPDADNEVPEALARQYELGQISAAQAGYGEQGKVTEDESDNAGSATYPGRNPYKGKTTSGKHPIKPSQRVRTAGDANSGDPDLR